MDIFCIAKAANAAEDAKKPPPGGREAAEVREDQTSKSGSSFSTWMLVSYFKTVPIELDEAARVDGASSFRIFWNIILPLIVPGIAAVAIFVLFSGWNEYMYSSVLISNDQLKTLTVGIISLNSQYQIKWNDLMAASTVSSLPLVVLFICFQKYFIAGMTGGAVKS